MAPIDPSRNAAPSDGVSAYPASAHDMALYEQAGLALERFGAPILIHENDPHERLYIAALDGTGNDRLKDPLHATNVARLADQVDHLAQARRTASSAASSMAPSATRTKHASRRCISCSSGRQRNGAGRIRRQRSAWLASVSVAGRKKPQAFPDW